MLCSRLLSDRALSSKLKQPDGVTWPPSPCGAALSPAHRPTPLARIAHARPLCPSPVHYVPGPQMSQHPACLDSQSAVLWTAPEAPEGVSSALTVGVVDVEVGGRHEGCRDLAAAVTSRPQPSQLRQAGGPAPGVETSLQTAVADGPSRRCATSALTLLGSGRHGIGSPKKKPHTRAQDLSAARPSDEASEPPTPLGPRVPQTPPWGTWSWRCPFQRRTHS